MLKEVTGTAQFDQKIESMNSSISDAQGKKTQLQSVLGQIKEKLDKLSEEIAVFNGFDKVEKDKKALERCLYVQKMQLNLKEIETQRQLKRDLMAEREKLLRQREEFIKQGAYPEKNKIAQVRDQIAALENKIAAL
jgi:chromosome segregation ATPase